MIPTAATRRAWCWTPRRSTTPRCSASPPRSTTPRPRSSRARSGWRSRTVRYFSPIAEVPFCGHATVATAIAIAEREGPGTVRFATPVGEIVIETTDDRDGLRAAFTSVDTDLAHFPEFVLDALLELLDVDRTQLDERYPPRHRLRRQLASGGRDRGCRRLRRVRVRSRRRARLHRRAGLADDDHGAAPDRGCGRRRPAVRGPQPLPRGTHHRGPRDRLGGGGGRRIPPRARRGASARPRASSSRVGTSAGRASSPSTSPSAAASS